jgi:hypothetical protein
VPPGTHARRYSVIETIPQTRRRRKAAIDGVRGLTPSYAGCQRKQCCVPRIPNSEFHRRAPRRPHPETDRKVYLFCHETTIKAQPSPLAYINIPMVANTPPTAAVAIQA